MNYAEIIKPYVDQPGGLIEAFHALNDKMNYLPEESIQEAARLFNLTAEEAFGVATFYSMFAVTPKGKNVIRICASAPCYVAGISEIVDVLEKELEIKMNNSTPDGMFRLEFTQCVGQCQETPVITINGKPFSNLTPEQIPSIIAEYKQQTINGGSR